MRRHGHNDMHGEWYAMPTEPCTRCGAAICIDCAYSRDGKRICEGCDRWQRMTPKQREEASR